MKKVLVVDDEKIIRDSLRVMLSDCEVCEIIEAENVEQGMAAYATAGPFDVYVIDLILPGAHGTCLVDNLEPGERCKVLVMSGFVDDNVYWMCEHLGLRRRQVLPKPLDFECLRVKLQEIEEGGVQ